MQFFIIVLIVCLVLFLYRIYHLGNDDYVLIKKNISLEEIFNSVILVSLFSLLTSRIFYVVLNPLPAFHSPLGFLLFPYFPGLSATGAVVGGAGVLFVYSRYRKFPIGRIFDFFSISFLFVLPFGFLGYFLLSGEVTVGALVKLVIFSVILFFTNIYLYPKASALEIKDGTISMLFMIFFSLVSLLGAAIDHPGKNYFLTHRENFILLAFLITSVILFLKQEITGRVTFKNGK